LAGGENFARLAAAEARGAERAHELEVHFGTLKSGDPGAGSLDARHGQSLSFAQERCAGRPRLRCAVSFLMMLETAALLPLSTAVALTS
jgi:hypothetical protein